MHKLAIAVFILASVLHQPTLAQTAAASRPAYRIAGRVLGALDGRPISSAQPVVLPNVDKHPIPLPTPIPAQPREPGL